MKLNQYLVEFLGAMLFVYVILASGNPLVIGATLTLIILLAKEVSGGYINPAVSIAMAHAGILHMNDLVPYILAQSLGALVAVEIYKKYKI